MTPSSRRGLELKLPGLLLLPQLPPTIYRSFERSRSRTLRTKRRRNYFAAPLRKRPAA